MKGQLVNAAIQVVGKSAYIGYFDFSNTRAIVG